MSTQDAKNLLQFTVLGLTLWILFNRAKQQGSLPVATRQRQGDTDPSPSSGVGSGFGGVGRVENFPVTEISHEQVQGTAAEMLDAALVSGPIEALAEWILTEHGLDFQPTAEAAMALTDYVNRSLPTHSDPEGRESMTDPETIAVMLLRGQVPASFDCLTGDTRIVARDSSGGYARIPIRELREGQEVLSYSTSRGRFEWQPITGWWNKGVRNIVSVRLGNGAAVNITRDHRLLGFRRRGTYPHLEWRLEETRVSDLIQYRSSHSEGSGLQLAYARQLPEATSVNEPTEMSWLEGMYLAEGHSQGSSVSIANDSHELREKVSQAVLALGSTSRESKRKVSASVFIHKGTVSDHLRTFGAKSWQKGIPDSHLSLAASSVAALLDGYCTGDGWVGTVEAPLSVNPVPVVMYSTISEALAHDLFFLHMRTGQPLNYERQMNHQGAGRSSIWRLRSYPESRRHHRADRREDLPGLAALHVRSIESRGRAEVYDIAVRENHNFVLADSGLVVHNCDDKAILLASLARSIGLSGTVAFFDLTGDGMIDHAMAMIDVPGRGPILAETTDPNKPLGWEPDYISIEYLVV